MEPSNYDKYPKVVVKGYEKQAFAGYLEIGAEIKEKIATLNKKVCIITVECYPGVKDNEVLTALQESLCPALVLYADNYSDSGDIITEKIQEDLTEDRVFGKMTYHTIRDFFQKEKLQEAEKQIEAIKEGIIFIYGMGASLLYKGDIFIYADMARWEIQMRFRRKELANWKLKNYEEDVLRRYKRGFFFEWRLADRLKKEVFSEIDYLLDTNIYDSPKMITKKALDAGLSQAVSQPFRVVPYFDPGVWGGQWMKEVCGLDKAQDNYAWSFDGVPEENSLYLSYGTIQIEVPANNVVFFRAKQLLGEKVYGRFGTVFPIRFNFLDTMGGQNLSLQVHPVTEYIQDNFGMNYTQEESYYILDSGENAGVYLGTKEGINPQEMIADLYKAQKGNSRFDAEEYINRFSAKKHDHFLIPPGTIHCSASNCMVLEVSSSAYIFTFKLWDWDRLGMDGLPRPVHIDHGKRVINWDFDTNWVTENLVNQTETLFENDSYREERTGLHALEFIETRRHWFKDTVLHNTCGNLNVLNLVSGSEAIVKSPTNSFEPFVVHYAETFIIPAQIGEYTITPYGKSEGNEIATIKAFVK